MNHITVSSVLNEKMVIARDLLAGVIETESVALATNVSQHHKEIQFANRNLALAVNLYDLLQAIIKRGILPSTFANVYDSTKEQFRLKFASTNPNKVLEFIEFTRFNDIWNIVAGLFDVEDTVCEKVDTIETEHSFSVNAKLKASTYDDGTSIVIAEDSGLIIPEITTTFYTDNLVPGVVSARLHTKKVLDRVEGYLVNAPEEAEVGDVYFDYVHEIDWPADGKNNSIVLGILRNLEAFSGTNAVITTFASMSVGKKEIAYATGTLAGLLVEPDNGLHVPEKVRLSGFGYNPIFYVPVFDMHLEDIALRKRVLFDHRSQAFNGLLLGLFKELASV